MSQLETPLFDALLKHRNRHPIQFHIPGHKKGQGVDPAFREFVGDNILSIDLINIAPLDDLHSPKGAIKQAQELAAQAFGADHTFFSVQGTSGAIMTMILSVVGPNDKILVPRNVHKSIMSAIVVSPVSMKIDLAWLAWYCKPSMSFSSQAIAARRTCAVLERGSSSMAIL